MFKNKICLSSFVGLMGLTFSVVGFSEDVKWTCTKEDKPLKVAGKDAKEKQADCEKQGGEWKKEEKAEPAKSESSGSGGGW